MKPPKRIVIGTRNRHKIEEIRAKLRGLQMDFPGLDSFPEAPEVVEDGESFLDNASKKARELARVLSEWVMADDSGLEVDALEGAPGVLSARYAGVHGDYEGNNRKLLKELAGVPAAERGARFHCVIALAKPGGEIAFTVEGVVEGVIAESPRGRHGFGYDPVFYLPGRGCTVAELTLEEKNLVSHRARAVEAFRKKIISL
jgi:XTP/dITP diphosphohydrolase